MSAPRLAVAAALLALTPSVALADIITSNTSGNLNTTGSGFSFGHAVTTGATGPWNTISFNFFALPLTSPTPYAEGTLFLLSQSYAGLPSTLSSATPGYIADTSTITAGAWDFADAVTLQANTQYFFYMAGAVSGAQLLFSTAAPYAGGGPYQSSSPASDPYFAIPGDIVDLRFSLNGSPVTDTPEPAAALLLAPGLLGLALRRRRT